jgi:glycosyltransferase involved in cell wall biosynthesis
VVPYAVDREAFFIDPEARRRPLPPPLEDAGRYIAFIGMMERNKNLIGAVEALANLKKKPEFADLRLVVVGGNRGETRRGYAAEVRARIKRLGLDSSIVILGVISLPLLRQVLNRAAVMLFPSLAEGFGLPPLEAMACGAPVVASDIPPLREVCGEAAIFADPRNPAAIALAVADVFCRPGLAQQMVERGLTRVAGFSWMSTAVGIRNVYERVFGPGSETCKTYPPVELTS